MEFVTIEINGITQSVPKADVALYLRAGYKVVEESAPEPAPVADPEPDGPEESAPVKKMGKKN